jgi:hypothetical protein
VLKKSVDEADQIFFRFMEAFFEQKHGGAWRRADAT